MPEHVPEGLLEQARSRRLADGADADRGKCDADLARGDVLVDALDLARRTARSARALLCQRLDPVAA